MRKGLQPGALHPAWIGGRRVDGQEYIMIYAPDHPRAGKRSRSVPEHILIAEHAIGRYLPAAVEVHHFNEIKKDNRNPNLVICEDLQYHRILHQRTRSLAACGEASWRVCVYCKEYDSPGALYINKTTIRHRACHAHAVREYQKRRVRG